MATSYKKPLNNTNTRSRLLCANKQCDSMGRYLPSTNFYKTQNPIMEYYPYCKDCANKMIEPSNLETVYNVLKALNYPYDATVWNEAVNTGGDRLLDTYLGLITSTYKKKFNKKTWEDSNFEIELKEDEKVAPELEEAMLDEVVWDDDWFGYYTKRDLKYLNEYFAHLKEDFNIVTVNHLDYARKIAQASLAMTKAYNDMTKGDYEAEKRYASASANFDRLSKSAQFAESQRGANDVSLGSFGQIFDRVEKNTYVPIYTPDDKDIYDKLIDQFSNLNRSL